MSGWQLVHKANETETVYKFHRSLKIAPGASVSVWSAGTFLVLNKLSLSTFKYLCSFWNRFRHWNCSWASFHLGDEGTALVCSVRNDDHIGQQQRRGIEASSVILVLTFAHSGTIFFVGNGPTGEQTGTNELINSPSTRRISWSRWSRRASPSTGPCCVLLAFHIFFSSYGLHLQGDPDGKERCIVM